MAQAQEKIVDFPRTETVAKTQIELTTGQYILVGSVIGLGVSNLGVNLWNNKILRQTRKDGLEILAAIQNVTGNASETKKKGS